MSVPGLKMESIAWGLNYSFFINCSTHCTPSSVVEAISLMRSTDQSPLIVSGFTWKITYRISAWSKTCQILHSVDQNLKTLVSLGSIDVVQTGQELILLDVDKRHLTLCVNKNTVQDLLIKKNKKFTFNHSFKYKPFLKTQDPFLDESVPICFEAWSLVFPDIIPITEG